MRRSPRRIAATAALGLIVLSGVRSQGAPQAAPGAAASSRWTDVTPDQMIDDAVARALGGASPEHARVAAVATIAALADQAREGHARAALGRVAQEPAAGADVRGDAALLARALAADEGAPDGRRADARLGVVEDLAILGPFRDNGGGLDAHDGPESAPGPRFDPAARYSWGSYEVAWREVPAAFATAAGVPLDVFVFPRKESCTWLATRLTLARPRSFVVHVAASGQLRVVFDGKDVARDEPVDESARLDRVAVGLDAAAGDHLLAAKVCSGALDDDGRVRLRVTDDAGGWPDGLTASSRLAAPPAGARFVASARTTALSRALAAAAPDRATPAGAAADSLLDAAILRTLAGADDLRSPRAPGLLAALADEPLDGDRAAMAAWVTPDRSNQGAWLTRARARGDAATRSFVDRRLIERHLEANLSDWAMATLRGAHLDEAEDDEAVLLASRVDLALGTDALRARAMHRLAAAARARPAAVSEAVLDLLARVSEPIEPRLALFAREQLAARGVAGADLVRVVASVEGAAAAAAAANRSFDEGGVDDAPDAVGVADAVSRAGDHAEALALYRRVARWAPNRASVWAGIAHEQDAPGRDAREAEGALRRARELDPGEARYRAELALRRGAPAPDADTREDEKYLVSSEAILARRPNAGAPAAHGELPDGAPGAKSSTPGSAPADDAGDVADRELYWLRAVVMHPDRRVSEMVQYAREIVIPPRTEDELYEDVPAEGDATEILRARVHRKDGGTAYPVEEADEGGRPRVRWPELFAGDVVEVAFRSWTAGPVGGRGDPPFYRIDYAGALSTHPVLYNEVVVESPEDHPIYVAVVHGRPDRREEHDEAGRHVVRLAWTKPVNVPDEPLSPQLSEVIPTVVLSTFRDWSAFRAWYAEAVRGFTQPDAQVREIAARLTAGLASRDDKVRALFDFVADDIRYVNYTSGEWWLPNRPQQLLARREGDCDDKALLLITLLEAVGIHAQEVMVQTRLTGQPSVVRAEGAAIPLFDHGIAFLPGPNGGRYLDATSPQSRIGPLPSMDARAVALRMEGPPVLVDLPASSPDDHGVDGTWTIRLAADGGAQLDGDERASGDDAFWMRTYLTEPGARAQWVEDRLLGGWFSTVQVDKAVGFRGDLPNGGAEVRWRARSDGLARREGSELVVPLAPEQPMASQLAPLVRRTLPVQLPPSIAPRRESRRLRVVAPPGWTFEDLPPGGDEDGGAFGRARLRVARDPSDPRAVVAERTVIFDQSTIPVEDYPKWRAWVQRVDALMHKALTLSRAGAPAAPDARRAR